MAPVYCVVFVTVPNRKVAAKLAKGLLETHLAACVNIIPNLESHYCWDDKFERSQELLLLIKSRTALIPDVTQFVKENHPYEVPEVISFPIRGGNQTYLDWVGANTLFTKPPDEKAALFVKPAEEKPK